MEKKYKLCEQPIELVCENVYQQIKALSLRLKRYDDRRQRKYQNYLFATHQGKCYDMLLQGGGHTKEFPLPPKEETLRFWKSIWSTPHSYHSNAVWLPSVFSDSQHLMPGFNISFDEFSMALKQLPNWKSPGIDGVYGYCLKHFTSVHSWLHYYFNQLLSEPSQMFPSLLAGRTTLVIKNKAKGKIPGNYRPITCLSNVWKVLSSIVRRMIQTHLHDCDLIPTEQKGCMSHSQATKDQLLIDKMVLEDAKKRHKNLSMAWIDFCKALNVDSVPPDWLLFCLKSLGIHQNICSFIAVSMQYWSTELTVMNENYGKVDIKRGIFQGDSLSPLLFTIALIPLSHLLQQSGKGYQISPDLLINHLLYMDDIKLYGRNDSELQSFCTVVNTFATDVCMSFGLDKCNCITIHRGKLKESDHIELPSGEVIQQLAPGGEYCYLGVLESTSFKTQQMKEKLEVEHKRRVRKLL